jgi:hypothetical protein
MLMRVIADACSMADNARALVAELARFSSLANIQGIAKWAETCAGADRSIGRDFRADGNTLTMNKGCVILPPPSSVSLPDMPAVAVLKGAR